MKNISKKDRETLKKIAAMMANANEDLEEDAVSRAKEKADLKKKHQAEIEREKEEIKDISNEDVYATQYGTLQDKCIANCMGEPKDWEYMLILIGMIGVFFVCPLIIYIFSNLIKYL